VADHIGFQPDYEGPSGLRQLGRMLPAGQKAEAERRFKQMEEVFAEIWRVRGR
jgi:succinate dehydrogenase/fumarate reductase-like Fe-S protein